MGYSNIVSRHIFCFNLGREWQIPNLRAFAFFIHRNKYR
jgi:hypothetical protein